MKIEVGSKVRDDAGFTYDVMEIVSPNKVRVHRDDGVDRVVSLSTLNDMFLEGKLEVVQ